MARRIHTALLGALLVSSVAACRTGAPATPAVGPQATPAAKPSGAVPVRTVQPGAPGEASRVVTSRPAAAQKHTPADTAFMQGMIGHHAQAIEMVALLRTRTSNPDMHRMGLRIEVSQNDEIRMMQTWLRDRGEAVPDEHAHHAPGAKPMPGMLTSDQMKQLTAARDAEFDRLFLEFMIQHHEGALVMVKDLMSGPGGGLEPHVFAFASEVESDQAAEITRMRRMRATMGK